MAKKVTVVLEDDLDGSAADETVGFALDGVGYEIDLSAENAAALRETFAPYVAAGRRAGRAARATTTRSAARVSAPRGARDTSEVRAWAREQGLQVSDRGRLPADVVAKFDAAHG